MDLLRYLDYYKNTYPFEWLPVSDTHLKRIKKLTSNIKEKGSRNETDRAKAGDLEYFWTWAELVYGKTESYPVDHMMLLDFVVSHSM